jgi:hypothetical protein
MPTWQTDIFGDVYEIDAPDEGQAATQALKLRQQAAQADPKKAAAYAATLPADQREQPSPMAAQSPIYQAVGNSTLGDWAGSVVTGTRDIAAGAAGQFGDVLNLGTKAANWLTGASPERAAELEAVRQKSWQGYVPTSSDVNNLISQYAGPPYQPQSTTGKVLRTGTALLPAVLSPGSTGQKLATWGGAWAGNELGGRGAALVNPKWEPYGRAAGTILGGGFGSYLTAEPSPISSAAKDLGVQSKDMTRIIKRMQQDGMTPEQINAELQRLGPDATLMDVGPNLRQEGQRIVAQGGEGRATISDALTARDAGANARIRGEVDAALGPAPIPSHIDAQITEGQGALGPAYETALQNGWAVDTTPIAQQLEGDAVNLRGRAQQAVQRVRGMLNVTGTDHLDPNPRTLFETRKAIDGMIATETDPNALRVLSRTRAQVDTALADAVPGIKDVDAQFAELARQREALTRGQQVLDSGRTAPRPQELAADFQEGALPQGTQVGPSAAPLRLRQGARADIERIIGTNANDRVALQRLIKGEGDWNRERLATLFGQDRADQIISVLDRERTFDLTSNRVIKNSATAERLPESTGPSFGVREAVMSGGPKSALYAGAIKGMEWLADKVRSRAASARDANVADLLTQTDRNRLVTALMKANGGKAVGAGDIDGAVRMMLLLSGSTQPLRQVNQ